MSDIINGSDGKPSGRRIIGIICFASGLAAGFIAMFLAGDWTRFIPMGTFIFSGLFLWGLVTIQNVQDIVSSKRVE